MKIKSMTLGVLAAFAISSVAPLVAQNNPATERSKPQKQGQVQKADDVLGKEVRTSDNQRVGEIEDLVVDLESGRILYAIVEDRAVPTQAFSEARGGAQLKVNRSKFEASPQVQDEKEQFGNVNFVNSVYQYHGQKAWWKDGQKNTGGQFGHVHKMSELKGMDVRNPANDGIGEIQDAAIDLQAGRIVYLVMESDLISGRENLAAVPPMTFTKSADEDELVADIDKNKIESAPRFSSRNWPNLSDTSYTSRVYQHFGKTAYFEQTGGVTPTGRDEGRQYEQEREKEKHSE